jgi:hypothetical protein
MHVCMHTVYMCVCVYVCVYTCMYVCMHVCVHVHIRMHKNSRAHARASYSSLSLVHTNTHTNTHACTYLTLLLLVSYIPYTYKHTCMHRPHSPSHGLYRVQVVSLFHLLNSRPSWSSFSAFPIVGWSFSICKFLNCVRICIKYVYWMTLKAQLFCLQKKTEKCVYDCDSW